MGAEGKEEVRAAAGLEEVRPVALVRVRAAVPCLWAAFLRPVERRHTAEAAEPRRRFRLVSYLQVDKSEAGLGGRSLAHGIPFLSLLRVFPHFPRTYGSGYPNLPARSVTGRGFPFGFWPIAWGAGLVGGAAYLYNDEVRLSSRWCT